MVDLVEYFFQNEGDILDQLREMVEMESPSTDKAAADRMARLLANLSGEADGRIEVRANVSYGDHVVARWGEGDGGLLILSHFDTVWPLNTVTERPWRVEDGRIYGPGVYDNKSSAAIVLSALKGLGRLGLSPRRPVTVIFNSDEEVGSPTSRDLIESEGARARVVFCMEPARPDGALKVWRKGVGMYTLTALGRASHAGGDHEKGINALEELAHQILRVQSMTDYRLGTTASVGMVRGGTRTNVVPERAEAWVDLRVLTQAEGVRIDAALKGLTPVLAGARLEVKGGLNRPPMEESPVTLEPFKRASEIAAELGFVLTASGTGGGSDGNFTAAMGVPTLDGLGAVGDGAHSVGEYVEVASLSERTALMAALLTRW